MTTHRFELGLFVTFFAVFLGFTLWQTPSLWRGPLTPAEIDTLVASLEAHVVEHPDDKRAFISRVRAWAAEDDGGPVLLLNLMRYRETLAALPAGVEFDGTPLDANAYYEGLVAPLALKHGEYPLLGGDAQAASLTPLGPATDHWDRVMVMRAPSRRAFVEFMADPAYGPLVPYKTAATELVLLPVDAELVIPDLRWIVGLSLLSGFLAIGWARSRRSTRCWRAPCGSGSTPAAIDSSDGVTRGLLSPRMAPNGKKPAPCAKSDDCFRAILPTQHPGGRFQ